MGKVIMSGVGARLTQPEIPSIMAGELAVGSSIFLNVNGTATEFLVVNQGIPSNSSLYDSSCNGTWLLMKNVYEANYWDATDNSYKDSHIHTYLNDTFLNLFDADVKDHIKTVKIPYVNGIGTSPVASGSSGLSTQIFLLSGYEVGWTTSNNSYLPIDGACLDYFIGTTATDSKRIGYLNGTANVWWLRSPYTSGDTQACWRVGSDGKYSIRACNMKTGEGVRPALVLPNTAKFDESTLLFIGV